MSLWAGLGVLKVMQTAMNTVWNVPYRYRPNFVRSILKAAIMLGVLGVLTLASAAAGSVGAGSDNWLFGIFEIAISLLLNFILFMLAFRILRRRMFPGPTYARAPSPPPRRGPRSRPSVATSSAISCRGQARRTERSRR